MPTTILIADDNDTARGRLVELIEKHEGWEVCAAVENGELAVKKAATLQPDLIVLDLAMPVMNGLQAAREIGKIMPSIPILIFTLHNSSWVEIEAKKAGARKVVFKPDVESLLSAIKDFITIKPQSVPLSDDANAPNVPVKGTSQPGSEADQAETPLAASGESDAPSEIIG